MAQDMHSELFNLGSTPENVKKLTTYLDMYPNKHDTSLLKDGFTKGFSRHYTGSSYGTDIKNLQSAVLHTR